MIAENKTTVKRSMNHYVQESPSVKQRCYAFVKRAFDIVASATALIVLSPIMLIAALAKAESLLRCGNSVVCT